MKVIPETRYAPQTLISTFLLWQLVGFLFVFHQRHTNVRALLKILLISPICFFHKTKFKNDKSFDYKCILLHCMLLYQ